MKKIVLFTTALFAGATWTTAQNALNFDGSNDIVQTNYSGVSGSTNRTFEAWIFVPSTAPASNLCILDYGVNAVGSRNTFAVSGTRKLTFTSGGTNANMGSTANNSVPEDQWVHVAFVLNGGTGYVYVNGIEEGTGSLTTVNTPTSGTNVRIGERVPGGSIPFEGTIDEVRVWSVARTQAEIQANMNAELCGLQPNLELYLKFNQGIAGGTNTGITSAADNSGNGNNGTLTNFALAGTTSNWVNGSGITSLTTTGSITATGCGSYIFPATSTVYTSTGIYTETLVGANSAGCDSIVTLDVTINNNSLGTDVHSACDSYTWIDGNTYTASNSTATFILTNAAGCDSIVVLNLTINNNTGTDVQMACDSYTWIDGNTYTSDNNTATVTLTNAAGCDSVVTLNLTVGVNTGSTDTQSACNSYTWIDGNTYTASNNSATFVLPNSMGCDSTITLDLTITNINSAVTQSADGVVLTSDESGATYQWVTCPNNTPIVGETSQTFTATANGDYAVIVTSGQCSDTSACSSVTTVSVSENELLNRVSVFPNPTNGEFSINLGEEMNSVTISITDLTGKLILSNTYENSEFVNVDLDGPAGVYLLTIESENKRGVLRLVKK